MRTNTISQAWWHISLIPEHRRLRQEEHEFKATLGFRQKKYKRAAVPIWRIPGGQARPGHTGDQRVSILSFEQILSDCLSMRGRKCTLSETFLPVTTNYYFFHSNEEKAPVLDGFVSDLMLTRIYLLWRLLLIRTPSSRSCLLCPLHFTRLHTVCEKN